MKRRNWKTGQGMLVPVLCAVVLCCMAISDYSVAENTSATSVPNYFHASHGFDGGLMEMVDLGEFEGFDVCRNMDDLARLASSVKGAVGFTAHPHFEKGERLAHAVLWYTGLSERNQSWALYLFDETEARKMPGEAPTPAAAAAAEAKVNAAMGKAGELIDAARPKGVKLDMSDYQEKKVLALAIMRLGGTFEHTGGWTSKACGPCRSVIPGGVPENCGHGVKGKAHWNCCGGTDPDDTRCRYWELIKAQDDKQK